MLEIAGGHIVTAHQDFAIGSNLHFDSGNRLANTSLARMKWMIQRHDGRGFGKTIALDHQKAEFREERFEIGRQGRCADDKAPELPAEQAVLLRVVAYALGAGEDHV